MTRFGSVPSEQQVPTEIDLLTGFTTGNRFDGSGGDLPGAASGFLVAGMVETTEVETSIGQTIASNVSFGSFGWSLGIEANLQFQAAIVDTAGAGPTVTSPAYIDQFPACKLWHLVLQCIQNGPNNDVGLWINGQLIFIDPGSNAYQPAGGGDAPSFGAGAFGNVLASSALSGIAYLEGTLTDDEIREHFFACVAAGDMVDAGLGWDAVWSVKRGNPGATWAASDGSGSVSRVGSLASLERPVGLWA